MAFLDHNGESEFPFSKEYVFNAMCIAIPTIKGMKVENADKLQGRILVKAGVSLYSWGENIPIQLIEISVNKTRVQITSSPKTGIMFGGAFDMGKNRKNIEGILSATSKILSTHHHQLQSTEHIHEISTVNPANYHQINKGEYVTKGNAWYDKTWLVIILCIIFFPIGLYALWKSSTITKGWKIAITAVIAVIVIANLRDSETKESNSLTESPIETEQLDSISTDNDGAPENKEKEMILEKLKAKAKRDWPNDYTTQEYWVNQEIEDYEYMLSIADNEIKSQAERDWPLDFSTQKYWYNEQIDARERIK